MRIASFNVPPLLRKAAKIATAVFCVACLVVFCERVWQGRSGIAASFTFFFSSSLLLCAELFLMCANLALETLRWKAVRSIFARGSLRDDALATLRGVGLGNVTPANIGEHVGRAMSYSDKRSATLASVVASVIQTAAIVTLGFISSILFSLSCDSPIPSEATIFCLFGSIASIITAALFFILFRKRLPPRSVWGWRVAIAFALNLTKVSVFSLQLAILLSAGEPPSPLLFLAVAVYYFFVTVVPRVNIIDVGVKGGLASWILTPLCDGDVVASAVIFIWALNIVVPSVAGYASLAVGSRRSNQGQPSDD